MDIGDLALEKGYLSAERLEDIRREIDRARSRGIAAPSLVEILIVRGYLTQEAANTLEDELLIQSIELPPSGRIAHYRLEGVIGEGASGVVYRATDLREDRTVALKVLPQALARNERYARRFIREARSAAALRHPNVVGVYEVGRLGETYFMAMELVEGKDLDSLLIEQGKMEPQKALRIVRQVASALQAARQAGIVHRDIKPGNIILDEEGRARLVDLGLAKRAGTTTLKATATADGVALGTPAYMAPEQARDARRADHRADIYSLGATFYHLLTGNLPFSGESPVEILMKVGEKPPVAVRRINPSIPRPYAAVLDRMMAKDPDERYEGPGALLRDLEMLEHGGARAFFTGLRNRFYLKRRWAAKFSAAALLVALGGLSAWAIVGYYEELVRYAETRPPIRVIVPSDGDTSATAPPQPVPAVPASESPDDILRQMLETINRRPRSTPVEIRNVIGSLKAFASSHKDTAPGREALRQVATLQKVFDEKRHRALAAALPALEALAVSMRYDTLAGAFRRLMNTWGSLDYALLERTRQEAEQRSRRLDHVEEGITLLLRLGLLEEARRETEILNRYWESNADRERIAALYKSIKAAGAGVTGGETLAGRISAAERSLAVIRAGGDPPVQVLSELGIPSDQGALQVEVMLRRVLASLRGKRLYLVELPAVYRQGTLDILKRKLTGEAIKHHLPRTFPSALRGWGELVYRTEVQRRGLSLSSTDYRPTGVFSVEAGDWATHGEPRRRALPFPIASLLIVDGPGELVLAEDGAPHEEDAPEPLVAIRFLDQDLLLRGAGPNERPFEVHFARARGVELWGNEVLAETYDGRQRTEVCARPRLRAYSFGTPPLSRVLVDHNWAGGSSRNRRKEARRLLESLPADQAYLVLEEDYPDCRSECAEAARVYARWLAKSGKAARAVETLVEAAVFCSRKDVVQLQAVVEEVLSGGNISGENGH